MIFHPRWLSLSCILCVVASEKWVQATRVFSNDRYLQEQQIAQNSESNVPDNLKHIVESIIKINDLFEDVHEVLPYIQGQDFTAKEREELSSASVEITAKAQEILNSIKKTGKIDEESLSWFRFYQPYVDPEVYNNVYESIDLLRNQHNAQNSLVDAEGNLADSSTLESSTTTPNVIDSNATEASTPSDAKPRQAQEPDPIRYGQPAAFVPQSFFSDSEDALPPSVPSSGILSDSGIDKDSIQPITNIQDELPEDIAKELESVETSTSVPKADTENASNSNIKTEQNDEQSIPVSDAEGVPPKDEQTSVAIVAPGQNDASGNDERNTLQNVDRNEPKIETPKAPEIETQKAPEIETPNAPETETQKAPEIETQKASEIETPKAPETETQNAPEIETPKAPKNETQNAPEVETQNAPEIETQNAPEINNQNAPKIDNQNASSVNEDDFVAQKMKDDTNSITHNVVISEDNSGSEEAELENKGFLGVPSYGNYAVSLFDLNKAIDDSAIGSFTEDEINEPIPTPSSFFSIDNNNLTTIEEEDKIKLYENKTDGNDEYLESLMNIEIEDDLPEFKNDTELDDDDIEDEPFIIHNPEDKVGIDRNIQELETENETDVDTDIEMDETETDERESDIENMRRHVMLDTPNEDYIHVTSTSYYEDDSSGESIKYSADGSIVDDEAYDTDLEDSTTSTTTSTPASTSPAQSSFANPFTNIPVSLLAAMFSIYTLL